MKEVMHSSPWGLCGWWASCTGAGGPQPHRCHRRYGGPRPRWSPRLTAGSSASPPDPLREEGKGQVRTRHTSSIHAGTKRIRSLSADVGVSLASNCACACIFTEAVPLQYSMRIRTSHTLSDTGVIVESRYPTMFLWPDSSFCMEDKKTKVVRAKETHNNRTS